MVSSSYREHEAAFLLGALGGYLTKTNKIGFIGGVSGVIQDRFQYGYMAGAWYSNQDVKVTSSYTGSFSDVGKGKEIATMMFSDGCDYVAPSAGACNLGVFQASKEAGADKWSFGAANGQFNQMPDKIVASQVKRVDNVAYSMVEKMVNGTLKGEKSEYGLKDGGVDLMYSTAVSYTHLDVYKRQLFCQHRFKRREYRYLLRTFRNRQDHTFHRPEASPDR